MYKYIRLYGHLNDIRTTNEYKPIFRYFNLPNHSLNDVDVTVIVTTSNNNNIRLRTEETYINIFKTRNPSGLFNSSIYRFSVKISPAENSCKLFDYLSRKKIENDSICFCDSRPLLLIYAHPAPNPLHTSY